MFQLKTRSEWEFAYWTLQHAREFDEVFIKSLKQKMRRQLREESEQYAQEHIVFTDGIDGYTKLVYLGEDEGADVEDVRRWCEANLWIHARPSLYDCTGQAFTISIVPVKRHGKWYAYHTIRFDI